MYVEHFSDTVTTLDAGLGLPIGSATYVDSELYDLQTDPYELRSRHADPAYAGHPRGARRDARAAALVQRRRDASPCRRSRRPAKRSGAVALKPTRRAAPIER